jgi:hypothetical protein
MVSAVKAVKSFINSEIAGPAGPSKAYRSEDTPPPNTPPPRPFQVRARSAASAFPSHPQCTLTVYNVECAGLMGLPAAGKDKCILVTFGTRPSDGAATFRVRHLVICMYIACILCIFVCIACILYVYCMYCMYSYVYCMYCMY